MYPSGDLTSLSLNSWQRYQYVTHQYWFGLMVVIKETQSEMKHLSAKPSLAMYYSGMKWSNHKNAQYTQLHNVHSITCAMPDQQI